VVLLWLWYIYTLGSMCSHRHSRCAGSITVLLSHKSRSLQRCSPASCLPPATPLKRYNFSAAVLRHCYSACRTLLTQRFKC
jgi:hypothetical protein